MRPNSFLSLWQLEEKARLEAEARAREHLLLREQHRRRQEDEEERLQEEFQRLQELQKLRAARKKKKERPSKDCAKVDALAPNFRAAAECAPQSTDAHNGSLDPAEEPQTSSHSPSRHADHPGPGAHGDAAEPGDNRDSRDSKLLLRKEASGKPREPLSFLLDMMHHHKEGPGKPKLKQAGRAGSEPLRKPAEAPPRPRPQPQPQPQPPTEPKARVLELSPLAEQKREERKAGSRKLNHVKEDRCTPGPTEPSEPTEPNELAQNGKPGPADSPQPRGRSKKGKKKKGERAHSSIGKPRGEGMGGEGRGGQGQRTQLRWHLRARGGVGGRGALTHAPWPLAGALGAGGASFTLCF